MAGASGAGFDPATHIIGKNIHGRYCVPVGSQHRVAAQCILKGKVWEEETLRFMKDHAGDGDIIHAGAYFGDFLPALSRAVAPGCKVWAFEPNPENYAAAAATCKLNDLQNVEMVNGGLGEISGMMKMRVRAEGKSLGGISAMVEGAALVPDHDLVEVPIYRIDDMVPRSRRISLLQLDVEGFEQPALAGALAVITSWQPILILETVPGPWLARVLAPLGYQFRGRLHENTVLSVSPVRLAGRSWLRRLTARMPVRFRAGQCRAG